jgi:hypothetical protein
LVAVYSTGWRGGENWGKKTKLPAAVGKRSIGPTSISPKKAQDKEHSTNIREKEAEIKI